jgi:hypothetical protein
MCCITIIILLHAPAVQALRSLNPTAITPSQITAPAPQHCTIKVILSVLETCNSVTAEAHICLDDV